MNEQQSDCTRCAHCGTVTTPWAYVFGLPMCSERCFIQFGASWLRERQQERGPDEQLD